MHGVEYVIRGLAAMPKPSRDRFIYMVVGSPADCGARCLDYQAAIEDLADELGVRQQVLIISEHLSQVGSMLLRLRSFMLLLLNRRCCTGIAVPPAATAVVPAAAAVFPIAVAPAAVPRCCRRRCHCCLISTKYSAACPSCGCPILDACSCVKPLPLRCCLCVLVCL